MGDTPFIKFYPSDFLGGTSGLSPAERGVYMTLLCLMYENDGPIQRDDARLSRRCGAPKAAFVKILDALICEGKIHEISGMLTNRRAEKAMADRTKRTQNSTHAANQRWAAQGEKSKQKQWQDNAAAMPEQCVGDASQKPEPDVDRDTNVSLARNRSKPKPERFEDFWDQYPHRNGAKKGKAKARAKYERLIASGISEHEIISGAMRYAGDRQVVEGYAKDPTTWLNNEGWTDDIEHPQSPKHNHNGSGTGQRSSMVGAFAAVAERRSRGTSGGGGSLI